MKAVRSTDVAAVRLPHTLFATARTPVYAPEGVDELLDECQAALESWERGEEASLRAKDVVVREIPRTRGFTSGYDANAVDDFLDGVAAQLAEFERSF
ncbi:DivIVA domain-containing protein [Microbacterium sp. KUDC0406]|uniref:DivIVA domain-containing protein n=1 Tax=Microbacterium sp. KUDC0406 TaxID=2909588 RepID=UPI001F4105FF|nr:DivIVA domain-containing protein [Microbacterium sp. KUDC0406]UJP09654.1 DivIVA domain-containing protein [Microbacterium sp. KUDC0406]